MPTPLLSYSDDQLVQLLRENDESAFNELYERYWKKLLIRAHLLLQSPQDAEEVVHDIFVSLWNKRATLLIHHSPQTYLGAMLQYACFKVLAERKRKRVYTTSEELPELYDATTQEYLEFAQLQRELESAVQQLPEKCQLVFRMSREQGLTDKEIAAELDVSVNTVRTQMHRALGKLKNSLDSFFVL